MYKDKYIPKIILNDKEIPIKDMSVSSIEIKKTVGCIDSVSIECIGNVEIDPVNTNMIEVIVYTPDRKKKFSFNAIEYKKEGD